MLMTFCGVRLGKYVRNSIVLQCIVSEVCVCVFGRPQLLRGAPDSLLRSLHIQKDPTAYNYIKVGGQIKVD